MRYLVLALTAVINLILTGAVFPNINIAGIAPDVIICTMTAIAVLERSMTGAGIGLFCGLVLDLMFSGSIGLYTIPYLITGAVVYFTVKSMNYIDNYLLPFLFAMGAYVVKELASAVLIYMIGIDFSLTHMFVRFILPETLLTGLFMILVHFIFTRIYRSSSMKPIGSEDIKL